MAHQSSRQYELVLLGATGYTGKLTAEWISTKLPVDLKWAIAGRNAKKLQSVADELKQLNPNRSQPAIETCPIETPQLTNLASRTRLLITTIGPFLHHGEPVLAACAAQGTHYLDCTGEVPWIYDMISAYDALARRTGAIIIPECGVDSVPADLTSYALATHVRRTLHAPTAAVVLSLYAFCTGYSGGTSSTFLELFDHYPLKKMAKALHPFSLSPVKPTNPTKPPTAPLFYRLFGLLNLPELGGIQTAHIMAGVDQCIAHRSWGLYERLGDPALSYGPRFRLNEYLRARSLAYGITLKIGIALFGLLLAFPPSRWIVSPLIRRFVIPKPGEGPSRESMKDDFLSYRAVAIADTERKEKVMGRLHTAHGGYAATAQTLSAAAAVILRGRLEETPAARMGGGILTPATLGDQFVDKLDEFGMKIQVGI